MHASPLRFSNLLFFQGYQKSCPCCCSHMLIKFLSLVLLLSIISLSFTQCCNSLPSQGTILLLMSSSQSRRGRLTSNAALLKSRLRPRSWMCGTVKFQRWNSACAEILSHKVLNRCSGQGRALHQAHCSWNCLHPWFQDQQATAQGEACPRCCTHL